ncbi:MAG: putative rane protein [Tardiphaga sp.]|uniref:hypothetical protein n=1 Tax=Tardiphaga sp. TaxID=1926292 RepID=UPI0026318C13|nr:hypothetical protein [Tardiphaga sp.]MDB5500672.1 putative rane protein [Tardiphaga sp.]
MFIQPPPTPIEPADEAAAIDRIVRDGPRGAVTVAGISVALLLVMWFAFYFLVFVPRSPVS